MINKEDYAVHEIRGFMRMFNKFYEACSVNKAESEEIKASRLSLCTVTAGTIQLLMELLGIRVVERL